MSIDFFLGLAGFLLSAGMAVSIVLSEFRRRARPPFLALFFLEAALFFSGEIVRSAGGPAFASSALSYGGTLIALPSLYLYGRSTWRSPAAAPPSIIFRPWRTSPSAS